MNATLAATASLAVSALHSIAKVSLSDKPVPASITGKYGNHNAFYSLLDKTSPEFDLQTGINWNPKQPTSDALWKKYVEKGKHFECLMSASERVAQNLIAGGTPVKSPWTVSRRQNTCLGFESVLTMRSQGTLQSNPSRARVQHEQQLK
jgi:hypothetical protein